jgi:RimJ/RimL family protein N-acetyltransferase
VQGFAMFSVVDRASGEWLGQVGPWQPEGWPGTEVGWALHRRAWGRGYATEAATAAIDWAFDALGWTEVIHCIDPANAASQRLAARLGSAPSRTTTLPPPYDDHLVDVWGQSRADWRARRHAAG